MAELVASEKKGKRSSLPKLPPRIDLTAMVDLAFLLITFFILTTSLVKPKAMDVAMPVDGSPGGWAATRTMTICLGKNDQVLWYLGLPDKPIVQPTLVNYSRTGLRAALINQQRNVLKNTGKPLIVILKPSSHSIYDNLVTSLDELNITNVSSYAIANISSKDVDMLKQKNAY
jgi:biopolymer transport protein ExbD